MSEGSGKRAGGLPFFLDLGTKGGIVFYSVAGIVLPWVAYSYMLDVLGYDIVFAGNVILIGYVGLLTVLWTGRCGQGKLRESGSSPKPPLTRTPTLRGHSYVFRVANKDMTYAQQLREYENAVIQKRFEELSEDEVDALMGEIYPGAPPPQSKE